MTNDEIAISMQNLINTFREAGAAEQRHSNKTVSGHSVSWWFDEENATAAEFMQALRSDDRYVVPGDFANSGLSRYLRSNRRMGRELGESATVIQNWIESGAPMPPGTEDDIEDAAVALSLPEFRSDDWYAALPSWFNKLVNIESHPQFLQSAKKIAKIFFDNADYSRLGEAGIYTQKRSMIE